jgi:TonB family protein
VIDAVDRVIVDRQSMDRGLSVGAAASFILHLTLLTAAVLTTLMHPSGPRLKVQMGFVVQLPPGGRGNPNVTAAAPAPPREEAPPAPKVEQKRPTIIKPPKEEPRQGLPALDARTVKPKKNREEPPAGAPASTGTSSQTPGLGLAFGPTGPGVPGGTDVLGDWYLAGVQRKIYMIWVGQMKPQLRTDVIVQFSIQADGSTADVRVVQSSGISLVDYAAQRAVMSAGPFSPLPKKYGTDRITIQAVFRPT